MATISAPGNLCTALGANGDSTNVIIRRAQSAVAAALRIASVAGATPTVTVNIQGSVDGVNWYNVPYALVATPSTFVVAALTITTTATVIYLLQPGQAWTYLKLVLSADTNVTLTADYLGD